MVVAEAVAEEEAVVAVKAAGEVAGGGRGGTEPRRSHRARPPQSAYPKYDLLVGGVNMLVAERGCA